MTKRMLTAACAALTLLGMVGAALAVAPAAPPEVIQGFKITEYADLSEGYGLYPNPAAIAVGPDGRVYVATEYGKVYALQDTDGDDQHDEAASRYFEQLGSSFPVDMVLRAEVPTITLYVTLPGKVWMLQDVGGDGFAGDPPDSNEAFVAGLSDTVQGLAFDSSGQLYVSVAANCDGCVPPDDDWGTVLRLDVSGAYTYTKILYALGLHSSRGLAFYPGTDDMFAPDDGRDDLGPSAPPDEFNLVESGRHYGWPHCWQGGTDPGWGFFCSWITDPLTTFPAHSSPGGLAFHDGTGVPPDLVNNAFVALRDLGAVQRVIVTPDGMGDYTATAEPFATGFQEPIDVAVGPDGAIYVADYEAVKIYCIRALPNLSRSWKDVTPRFPHPGDSMTYTLYVVAWGPGSPFTLTDPIPLSTTYVPGSAWRSTGNIDDTGGVITWQGVVSENTTVTATFVVQVPGAIPTPTAIINTATLTGAAEDEGSPYTLLALAIVDPLRQYLPLSMRTY